MRAGDGFSAWVGAGGVRSLDGLQKTKLTRLGVWGCKNLEHVNPLKDLPLTSLDLGLTAVTDRPERLASLVTQELARWNRVVANAKILGD